MLERHMCVTDRVIQLYGPRVTDRTFPLFARKRTTPESFWADIDLDLSHAALYAFDFQDCRVRRADFSNAKFYWTVQFGRTIFEGEADFAGAHFTRDAWFTDCRFSRLSNFRNCKFEHVAEFDQATFTLGAVFSDSVFKFDASFAHASFEDLPIFENCDFENKADFSESVFVDNDVVNVKWGWLGTSGRFFGTKFHGELLLTGAKGIPLEGAQIKSELVESLPASFKEVPCGDGWIRVVGAKDA